MSPKRLCESNRPFVKREHERLLTNSPIEDGILTDVCIMELRCKALEHEPGQRVSRENELAYCNTPLRGIALEMPIPVWPRFVRIERSKLQRNHLSEFNQRHPMLDEMKPLTF